MTFADLEKARAEWDHALTLAEEARSELEAVVRFAAGQGIPETVIAERTKLSRTTIRRWLP